MLYFSNRSGFARAHSNSAKIVVKETELRFDLVFLVSARSKIKPQSNGGEPVPFKEMPLSTGATRDCTLDQTAALHPGARLAAKLNTKIIVDDAEFNNPGELSVDARQLYHDTLAAMFPSNVAVLVAEARKSNGKKIPLIVLIIGFVTVALYFCLRGVLG